MTVRINRNTLPENERYLGTVGMHRERGFAKRRLELAECSQRERLPLKGPSEYGNDGATKHSALNPLLGSHC